jgi:hypothetical protein
MEYAELAPSLKRRFLRSVLKEIIADTTAKPPTVRLKLHWMGTLHTELIVRKTRPATMTTSNRKR